MKKLSLISMLLMLCVSVMAQSVTLTFTGKDANNNRVQLDRVSVTNLTKGWQETIYWPDTTLTMQNGTGIDDYANNGGFVLSQNNPNPFNGTTDVLLTVADAGAVTMEIMDANGRMVVETTHALSLPAGTHQFRVSLSAAGTYVMTARQNGKMASIKMVNNGGGNANGIEYAGEIVKTTHALSQQPKSDTRGTTNNPFNFGDIMEYVGYATINGTERESQHIAQTQDSSQTFVVQFSVSQQSVPTVNTSEVIGITGTTATCGGNVTSNGGSYVHTRGVCWSRFPTPTTNVINCSHTSNGSGIGSFTSELTGLTGGTTYYVRAYAINNVGTGYGEEMTFTTSNTVPTVSTNGINNITDSSATCGGYVFSDGGAEVTARGVCWSTSPNPTIEDVHTTDSTGIGSFNSVITGLTGGTQYYMRAYATNNVGTGYGNEFNFVIRTQPCPGTPTVTDICGNTYNTVQIGVQCWMKENLRTTRYSDSTAISEYCEFGWFGSPNSNSSNIPDYGLLYSWEAVMHGASSSYANPSGVQGVCPQGWHVPSSNEWGQLRDYVRSQSQFFCDANDDNIAKALADSIGWRNSNATCAVGNILSDNNATGFGARPAGLYSFYHHTSYDFGAYAYFWTCSGGGYYYYINRGSPLFRASNYTSQEWPGYSVRCLKD